MNNKGFAISTLIYGLSIMGIMLMAILMGTISSNRNNTREISQEIEKGLISYSKTESLYTDTSTPQQYVTPDGQAGWYRIELWGAQGGTRSYGAYTSGVIKLDEGDILYFNIGKKGNSTTGGQSTDVRVIDGEYDDSISYNTRIMVAAGGGSGSGAVGGTLEGYQSTSLAKGGVTSADGVFDTTKTSLVGFDDGYNTVPGSGTPKPKESEEGGSGYYSSASANVGGTSWITGYAGCSSALHDTDGNNKETDYYFVDGFMMPGVNAGNGKAKITKVVNEDNLKIINNKLKSVKTIKDCIGTTNPNISSIDSTTFKNAIVMSKGTMTTLSPSSVTTETNFKCVTYNVSPAKALDEIAVWHGTKGVDYYNHKIEVQNASGTWSTIKNVSSSTNLSVTETATGIHISAYQYDSTGNLPAAGNYYIVPVLEENKVLTAPSKTENSNNPITASPIDGGKNQIWSIEKIDSKLNPSNHPNEYRVIDLERYKAMSVSGDENKIGNTIVANTNFNNTRRNEPQIWTITPEKNGTYTIKTVMSPIQATASGYLVPKTRSTPETIIIGKSDINGQRYRLIPTEYTKSS